MRLSEGPGGPIIGNSSFLLPRKRGAAATARDTAPPVASSSWRAEAVRTWPSKAPTTTAPDRGTANSLKLTSITRPPMHDAPRSGHNFRAKGNPAERQADEFPAATTGPPRRKM